MDSTSTPQTSTRYWWHTYHLWISLLLLLSLSNCKKEDSSEEHFFRTWDSIIASDTLRVGSRTSPTSFYLYRGEPFGLEYQKAKDFAQAHQLSLDIHISNNTDTLLTWLQEGVIDLVITPLPKIITYSEVYRFAGQTTTPYLVLVQHENHPQVSYLSQLAGEKVYVESNSAGALRLQQIEEEIGAEIHTIPTDTLSAEQLLLEMSESDTIPYLITDNRIAEIASATFPSLNVSLQVSVPIKHSWVVHRANKSLATQLDHFFEQPEQKEHYQHLTSTDQHLWKFFQSHQKQIPYATPTLQHGAISPYDHLFQSESKRLGWHWTFLAAIAFQESRFQAEIIGWSGARGLMGIMPSTGRAFGVSQEELLQPQTSVRVAVDCLLSFGTGFQNIPTLEDRICFTLAAYNAGNGHILDAIRLAEKYNAAANKWYGGVREYVLLKSNPTYYEDPIVKYGYMRGKETVDYVDEVMHRQGAYQALIQKQHPHKS